MATKGDRPDWALIRRAWEGSTRPLAVIGRDSGAPVSTIRSRARREGWASRPVASAPVPPAAADPVRTARLLYDDLGRSLTEAIDALRAPLDDDPREARGRAELVRAHQKALGAVLAAQATLKEADAEPAAPLVLDLDAARRDLRARLDRLMAHRRARGLP